MEMKMTLSEFMNPRYLGDAVYAHYLNGMIGLSLGSHTAPVVVWLEPSTLDALNQYAREALSLASQDQKP